MNLSNKFFDIPEFDFEGEKKKFIENLNFLKLMTVQEQTLYKKWQEFNKNVDFNKFAYKFDVLRSKIWKPTDINNFDLTVSEIENLNPHIEIVKEINKWQIIFNIEIFLE